MTRSVCEVNDGNVTVVHSIELCGIGSSVVAIGDGGGDSVEGWVADVGWSSRQPLPCADGYPDISYYDDGNGGLKYASYSAWKLYLPLILKETP